MSWSSSDNFFVNAKLEVFKVDLFSESLELTRSKGIVYDGPKGDDFKRFLRSSNFLVNRQGKAIVCIQKCFLECQYNAFILETVVPLGPFGFQNIPLPKSQEVNELQSLLENTKDESAKKNNELTELKILLENMKAELVKKNDEFTELQSLLKNFKAESAKKNDELTELQSLLKNIKAESAKKNDELNELQSLLENAKAEMAKKNDALNELMKQKTDQDWNREQFRLTMIAINNSLKRVFIEYGLEPPASGDQESVLRFLEMLRDLILHKEFSDTFVEAMNVILASMASIFEKRTGLSIGMETMNTTPSTPACLIKSLSTLRDFMVDSHFFIDGSVIVKDFHLMNEDDLLVIFRDSATDVSELKKKEIGSKSISDIDTKSIFYGYYNIPMVGMFKGVLTRVHVTLPDEIMVKLQVGKHNLNNERFWFVYANGSGIFEKEELDLGSPNNLEVVKFAPSRVLGDSTDFEGFLCRMNRIFVNEKGTYLKLDFIAGRYSGSRTYSDSRVRYYTKDFGGITDPFRSVQFDVNTPTIDIRKRQVYLPELTSSTTSKYPSCMLNEALGKDCAFTFNDLCFTGKIRRVSGTFRENALVSVFFEKNQHGENCYVDALATTFFVLSTDSRTSYGSIGGSAAPKFI